MKPKVGDKVLIESVITGIDDDGDFKVAFSHSRSGRNSFDAIILPKYIVKVIPRKFQVGDFVKCAHADKNYKYEILAMHKNDLWVKRDGSAPFTVLKQNVTRWED